MSETYQGLITITDLTDNKACEIRGVNVFKYNENSEIPSASSSITLTAILSDNISGSNWQYKNSLGNFVDFSPITTGDTITINHTDDIFIDDIATIKKLTSDESVFDIFTITKIRDGQTGTSPINIVLGNVADVIPCDVDGKLKTDLIINIPFTAYKGTSQISATINKSNITTRPSNLTDGDITITSSTTSSSGNIQFTLYAGSELGNNSGEITLTFTCDEKQVPMKYGWSKSIQAPPGADGKTYYTWIKYADSPTSGMSDNPSGKAYIGIAHNKASATESTTYSDYTWSLIKGETGAEGNGITTITQYYAKTTTFSKPNAESITSTTMPELDNTYRYLWMKEVIAFTKSENQTVITLIAARGDNGEMSPEQVAQLNKASQDASDAVSKVDNLEIGGRNYFSNKTNSAFNEANEFTLANYQNTGSFTQFRNLTVPMSYFVGKKCILSFDCISPNGSTPISVYNNNGSPRYLINTSGIISPINNEWTHQELIITVTDRGDSSSYNEDQSNKIEIYCSAQMGCKIKNVKLEIGNRATDWTPAPEDVDAGIKDAARTATNFIHSDDTIGLVVNNNQTVGVGYDVQLKANGSDTGMNIRQDGNILASFLQNSVSLGKNSINSKVGMCGDKGGVSASFGYYVASVSSTNAEMGSTLDFDFNETTFKNKVGQEVGFYHFIYTSADGWTLLDPVNDTSYAVTLSQYGITLRTAASALDDYAQITIKYVLDGSVKFYNADISNPVRKLELEMAENPSSSESDFANITIERQSGTYANGDGKEHSIITMMTLHEFANVATLQLFDDSISLDATHLYLNSTHGEGAIELSGNTYINGIPIQGCHKIATSKTGGAGTYIYDSIDWYMNASQTLYLEETISNQQNGIILVWSFYNSGVKDWGWNFTVVPKTFVTDNTGGSGMSTFMAENSALGNVGAKYIYVRDDRIIGNDTNGKAGTGASAIKYNNNRFVLRWVYGF